jgi:OPT family oligopeptide transporter
MLSFRSAPMSEHDRIEAPMSWFATGQIVSLVALAWLGHASFGMPVWESVVAVALSFLLALVACRVTGETDTTPVGAMGKVTQLIFGALSPGHVNVNLMSANITAGAATSSADLLTDLKSGYLLGAHPRQQFIAQFSGIFIGTVVSVLAFAVLVPNAQVLGTDQFPAPAAQTWSAVAIALGHGLSSLESVKLWLIFAGGLVGMVLTLAPVLLPKHQEYLPSAAAFGLAWVFHWYYGLLFFLGALVALLLERRKPKLAEEFTLPVASGVVAGGSLMGVVLVFWANGGSILNKLLGG